MAPVPWTIDQIVSATGGEQVSGGASVSFEGISIDSRNIAKQDLFVAVKGANHDGHAFIPGVIASGVKGLVVDRRKVGDEEIASWTQANICCVAVADTVRALGDLAAFHRRRFHIPVVAVTGSNGKTSTKELSASVLGRKYHTLKTIGNLNNEFGVPLTLLRLNASHQAAVVEMGMNHSGEIRRLSEICQPDYGIITNVAPAHLEGLGSLEEVMAAKGELMENIKESGAIVLNGDDPCGLKLGASARCRVVYFGQSAGADVRGLDIQNKAFGTQFTLVLPDQTIPAKIQIDIPAPGRFMVSNALAAATIGYLTGVSAEDIHAGIAAFAPVHGRMNIRKSRQGFFIIDDSYNANPGSMEAAIKTLVTLKGTQKGVLAAGDMLELGADSERLHEDIGRIAAQSGINMLFLTGEYAAAVKKGASKQGMTDDCIVIGEKADLAERLADVLGPEDWVLVKGSRSVGMETIVHLLEEADKST
ncbi:MAG: UDP-N-acetylmuramoyl-tripeptide--D-alanyl-D-alanine ligase [Desulfobacteraceae bacterium]|nr:MAG: UDP-N-acetylmuramoyl-tripeptide--D-alanyl-D-alanine ligase [Desulfobacteraceae bacterium]